MRSNYLDQYPAGEAKEAFTQLEEKTNRLDVLKSLLHGAISRGSLVDLDVINKELNATSLEIQEIRCKIEGLRGDCAIEQRAAQVPSARLSVNTSLLATKVQLIAAFGAFTGMDTSWFSNLKDKPKLRAARKVAGQGQRGKTVEPLFCPYEVMLWLTNPGRKVGRQLGSQKGWDLLSAHFPASYNAHSIGDPS